jgi:hypothetical protein
MAPFVLEMAPRLKVMDHFGSITSIWGKHGTF